MKLVYRCFGTVAFLEPNAQAKKEGTISVEANVEDGCILSLYSEAKKEKRDFLFAGGKTSVPAEIFDGAMDVQIHYSASEDIAKATPIVELQLGDEIYLVGGEFSAEEERARICRALGYVGILAERAIKEAQKIPDIKADVAALQKRANSGDIMNF